MTLAVIAAVAGLVAAGAPPRHRMKDGGPLMDLGHMLQPTVVATHTFRNAPALDVLLVPGGTGNVALEQAGDTSVEDFVRLRRSVITPAVRTSGPKYSSFSSRISITPMMKLG